MDALERDAIGNVDYLPELWILSRHDGGRLPDSGATAGDPAAGLWSLGRMDTHEYVPEREYPEPVGERQVFEVPRSPSPVLSTGTYAPDWRGQVSRYGGEAVEAFSRGYRDAGGAEHLLAHIINDVIPCEYGWGPYVKVNYYESRAQFAPSSWAGAGGGDPADDYQVGGNMARWIAITDEGTQWPVCWHRGGW